MKRFHLSMVVAASLLTLAAGSAAARLSSESKCEAGKNQEAGKYSACLHKAEVRLIKTKGSCSATTALVCHRDDDCPLGESCSKDTARYADAVTKCRDKFDAKWSKLETKAVPASCPDGLAAADIRGALDASVANVAGALAGNGLTDCATELSTCAADLSGCAADLTTCDDSLVACSGDLADVQDDLTSCTGDLGTCTTELAAAQECGNAVIDAGEDCDLGSLGGASCASEGFGGGNLACGANCQFDTSACYAARFVDNADGTITDHATGLTWEKKVKLDATVDLANLQDADNAYAWSGACSLEPTKRCQPTAASAATCMAGAEGSTTGCAECGVGEGSCEVEPPGVTIWQWLDALNAASFAGYSDWRMPTRSELVTLIEIDHTSWAPPVIDAAFHGPSCGTSCADVTDAACACTPAVYYLTRTTYAPATNGTWIASFSGGDTHVGSKLTPFRVRAVRDAP